MGTKVSLGMMELKKITIKTEETEDDEKTSYVHTFEHVAGNGKFTATLPERLYMKMGKIMELTFVDNQAKLSEFKDSEPDEKKEAIEKGKAKQKRIPEETENTEVLAEKEVGKKPKTKAKDEKPDKDCKFCYQGDLCANSNRKDPKCHGACEDKIARGAEDKSEMEKPAKAKKKGGKPKKEPEGQYEMTGTLLLKKTDFPTDVLGGLKKDIVVEKNMKDNFLYAHATSMKKADKVGDKETFSETLKDKTGLDWEWMTGNTYAADQKQLNKE